MKKMNSSNVLVFGADGLGIEICKNIILSGVKSVILVDDKLTNIKDLSTNFYLTENDIGINRAVACKEKLSELNNYVNVYVLDMNIDNIEDIINYHNINIVVSSNKILNQNIKLNNICRSNKIYFISGFSYGLYGNIFVDLGDKFIISDIDGEKTQIIFN